MQNETKTKNLSWWGILKAVWYFLEEDKKAATISFFTLMAIFFYELVPTYFVGKIVDFFTKYSAGQSLTPFYFYCIFIGATWIIVSIIRLQSKRTLNIIGQKARSRARIWGFERLTEFSLEWHSKENTGNKLQRIFTGADAVVGWSKMIRKDLLRIFANIFGVIIFFVFISPKFIVLVLIFTIIFMYIEFAFSKRMFQLSNEFNKLNQNAGGVYVESANNMLSIKALGSESGVMGRVSNNEKISRDVSIERSKIGYLKWKVLQTLTGVTLGVFLIMTGHSVMTGAVTVGMVLVLYTYFRKLQDSLGDISEIHSDLIDLRSDLSQMMPIFQETEFIKTGNEVFPKDWDKIEIKNANMDYGSGQMGLVNFNLTLVKNSKTGIAGLSGSGKSTLAKIILGLYALKEGEFKIGNKNYYAIKHNETLSHITVVLQETELFNLTLRDNITMMREGDTELLEQAIKISQLEEVIKKLPDGLDALIGEKGYMLSGGERQRLGIARAIYKNAPIIILDEATSSLDSETESKIMEKLLGVYGEDKTFLIIAHRLGTLKYTDNIAVMEHGQVVEEGSYGRLMNNSKSVFYRMNGEKKQ
jgi:ABC-type multidrug transport system fused ATPase/permease subunit